MTQQLKDKSDLKKGWTTGACSTACAVACVHGIINQKSVENVTVDLPAGSNEFKIINFEFDKNSATATTIKDAGDDPDITHGAEITVTATKNTDGGVKFVAGEGVGTITKDGLPLAVGEPAINPKPREMIEKNIVAVAGHNNWTIEISVADGEKLAEKTWNPRLGIMGGISILGTTGAVIPYSCSAWIHSIYRGIDVAIAGGINHIVGSTGKTSERLAVETLGFDMGAYIDMGDFVGDMLRYAKNNKIDEVTISGGFAKMVKLAQGNRDLHSARSQVDFEKLSETVFEITGDNEAKKFTAGANTALEVLQFCGNELAGFIAKQASIFAQEIVKEKVKINVMIVSRDGVVLSHYKG